MLQPHSDMMDMNSIGRSMTNQSSHNSTAGRIGKFLHLLVPHVILVGVFFVYLTFGAVIFTKLEGPEIDATKYKAEAMALTCELHEIMLNISAKASTIHPPIKHTENSATRVNVHPVDLCSSTDYVGMTDEIQEKIHEIMKKIIRPKWKIGRVESMQAGRAWSFQSAMLFCMTTITTIGYGDIVPVTAWGRAFCVIYAIVGIPLSLLCLASIGNLLARLTLKLCRFVHIKMYLQNSVRVGCCRSCLGLSQGGTRYRKGKANAETDELAMEEVSKSATFRSEADEAEQTEYKQDKYEVVNNELNESPSELMRSISIATERPTSYPNGVTSNKPSVDGPEPCECERDQAIQTVDILEEVPLLIVVVILIGYICAGAAMMSTSEGWSYGTGLYFMFITITTIGFGDILPTNRYAKNAFVPCILFTLFGLAVMSMCIAFVQAKVIRAFKQIQRKLDLCKTCI